ncbi:MAG: DUF4328 domain-containing protein [Candidatus Aerophobetes bacterium]|nr:DUF4328 domain-containing protein [Candidatus Aerophobetes bacterium]
MSIEDLASFQSIYNTDEYTPEAQKIINEVLNERKTELEEFRKSLIDDIKSSVPKFVSSKSKAKLVIFFLAIAIVLGIIALFSNFMQIDLLTRMIEGNNFTLEETYTNDIRQQTIRILQLIIYFVTGIFFLIWFYQAHRNLQALGSKNLKYTSGWAIGGFFIPFLNLVRPFQVMKEVWKESDPNITYSIISTNSTWKDSRSSSLVGWWWFLFLFGNFISYLPHILMQEESIDSLLTGTWVMLSSEIVEIIAAIVTIGLVKKIVNRQKEKYKKLKGSIANI